MILQIFDYCAVIWDSCNKTNRDYLDKLHRRAASIIEGHKVSQSQVSRIFIWPSLQSRRDYLKCSTLLTYLRLQNKKKLEIGSIFFLVYWETML